MTTIPSDSLARLRSDLDRADYLYHGLGRPEITDEEYDDMKRRLRAAHPDDPILIRVGWPPATGSALQKVRHAYPMGSLQNAMSLEEILAWDRGIGIVAGECALFAEPKWDGISCSVKYVNGRMVQAATRGNGAEGEDITHNARLFQNLPLHLPSPFTGVIRGEVVLPVDAWVSIDPEQATNPRNRAAGIARRLDSEGAEMLRFIPFGTGAPIQKTRMLLQEWFRNNGFTTGECVNGGINEIKDFFEHVSRIRPEMMCWIDGVVVRVNDEDTHRRMGSDRASRAWKFPAQSAVTVMVSHTVGVGHSGKVTPVAHLEPVKLGGTTIQHVSLCNFDEIARLGLSDGDSVEVIRSGDVIPKIVRVVAKGPDQAVITAPDRCQSCGSALEKINNQADEAGVDIFCRNNACPARNIGRIAKWVKDLDIKGIGDEVLEALMRGPDPLVRRPCDIHRNLTPEAMASLLAPNKLGMKRATKICESIKRAGATTLPVFLGAFGIRHLGSRRVKSIIAAWRMSMPLFADRRSADHLDAWFTSTCGKHFGTEHHESFLLDNRDILHIPGMARDIQARLDEMEREIRDTAEAMVILPEAGPLAIAGPLTGKSFVLTGKMSRPRNAIAEDIRKAGGTVEDDVSAGVTALVQADPSSGSGKSVLAKRMCVAIIGEGDLVAMMSSPGPSPIP